MPIVIVGSVPPRVLPPRGGLPEFVDVLLLFCPLELEVVLPVVVVVPVPVVPPLLPEIEPPVPVKPLEPEVPVPVPVVVVPVEVVVLSPPLSVVPAGAAPAAVLPWTLPYCPQAAARKAKETAYTSRRLTSRVFIVSSGSSSGSTWPSA